MNLDIKKRIDSIANPESIRIFFKLINRLITENSISMNDERLALTMRNDRRNQFSVNINGRLVLYFKAGNELGFMINQDDWYIFENIPFLKKEVFEKYEPSAFLVYFSLLEYKKNKDLIESHWLKSCKAYLPSQEKSQYRKHNIQELYKIAWDEGLLNRYIVDSQDSYSKFQQIIYDFKVYIQNEDSDLNDFEIQNVYQKYVWISDAERIIGKDSFCHYELITRNKYPDKIWIELHFDKKLKKQMRKYLDHLLVDSFFWNNDHGEELSLALQENVDFNDPDLFNKLESGILKLEENFGKIVRDYYLEEKKIEKENKDKTMQNIPLNQILYGPPGTGKTYNTINRALTILESKTLKEIDSEDRNTLKLRFDDYVKTKQIVFSTFHQSMSYEDFVEGIKPHTKNENVTYSIEDGFFKQIVKSSMIEYLDVHENTNSEESFDAVYIDFINSIRPLAGKREAVFTTKTGVEIMLVDANENSIQIKYLWSSKKKENEGQHAFSVTKEKLKRVLLEGIEPIKVKSLQAELFPLVGHIHCELFAVYKSFYNFVIENNGEIETIKFNYEDQTFEEIKEQFNLIDKEVIKSKIVKPYILIIDEINRGNVSQIFGELITLIEDSKRLGNDENLEVTLPYSKTKFGVPSNLYIIGTMNTADRSVEALDTALRRRFSFQEMMPDLEVLNDKIIDGIVLKELLSIINKRVEILLDRDHLIGHSYFINIESEDDLKNTFKNNIIPLLQEYFYGDYEKIGLILGQEFFQEDKKYTKDIFAKFSTQNYSDGGNLMRLKIIDDDFKIIKALEVLLKKEFVTNA